MDADRCSRNGGDLEGQGVHFGFAWRVPWSSGLQERGRFEFDHVDATGCDLHCFFRCKFLDCSGSADLHSADDHVDGAGLNDGDCFLVLRPDFGDVDRAGRDDDDCFLVFGPDFVFGSYQFNFRPAKLHSSPNELEPRTFCKHGDERGPSNLDVRDKTKKEDHDHQQHSFVPGHSYSCRCSDLFRDDDRKLDS